MYVCIYGINKLQREQTKKLLVMYCTSKNCGSPIIEFGGKKIPIECVNLTRNCFNKTAKDVDGVSDQIFLAGEYGYCMYMCM